MNRIAGALVAGAAVVSAIAIYGLTRGPEAGRPNPAGTFSFAVLGDAPYDPIEDLQYPLVLGALNNHDLSFVVHVGDIFWRPCSERLYRRGLVWFEGLRHPLFYTPGDNEWFDCWEPGSGSHRPLDRLALLRRIYFADPRRSLGGRPLGAVSQADSGRFDDFPENQRWSHQGIVFATLHVIGSRNGRKPFPGRTAADDDAAARRTEAAVAWMQEAFAAAKREGATAVVLAFHANPGFEAPVDDDYRLAYEPFLETLEKEVEGFPGPVLIAQGDDHEYLVDHPLARRTTGRVLANLTRLQVPGSPRVGWVRVVVTPGPVPRFQFEQHVVPRWKYW